MTEGLYCLPYPLQHHLIYPLQPPAHHHMHHHVQHQEVHILLTNMYESCSKQQFLSATCQLI